MSKEDIEEQHKQLVPSPKEFICELGYRTNGKYDFAIPGNFYEKIAHEVYYCKDLPGLGIRTDVKDRTSITAVQPKSVFCLPSYLIEVRDDSIKLVTTSPMMWESFFDDAKRYFSQFSETSGIKNFESVMLLREDLVRFNDGETPSLEKYIKLCNESDFTVNGFSMGLSPKSDVGISIEIKCGYVPDKEKGKTAPLDFSGAYLHCIAKTERNRSLEEILERAEYMNKLLAVTADSIMTDEAKANIYLPQPQGTSAD